MLLWRLPIVSLFALTLACSDPDSAKPGGSSTGGQAGSSATGGTGGTGFSGGAGGGGGSAGGGAGAGTGGSGTGGASGGSGGSAGATGGGGSGGSITTDLVWPNEESRTNSDDWLVEHHDQLSELRPRVLVVNFATTHTGAQVEAKAEAIAAALAEGSRYHGYSNASAPPFLNYQIAHFVDLSGQPTRNGGGFGYVEFMTSQSFADKVGFVDPDKPGDGNLTVCELFERGLINEAWVGENADDSAKLYEFKSLGQRYDENFQKLDGNLGNCAGNGCIEQQFECGVTVRLGEINPSRGPGCATHAFGHGIESYVKGNFIPYFTENATRFFNFGLDERYGTPFDDFYVCPYNDSTCIEFLAPNHLKNGPAAPSAFEIDDFGAGCGNVHFAPHSRYQYDYENGSAGNLGRASCEGYGLGAGAGGEDQTADIDYDVYREYNQDQAFNDCGGGWQLYLRQSFPGRGNAAKDTDGNPMKNWWPFLFY